MIELRELPAYNVLPEPLLLFHPDRRQDITAHPLEGLLRFGPFSASLINNVYDPIRIATVSPVGERKHIQRILREMTSRQRPQERLKYLPEYPGFANVFRVGIVESGHDVALPKDTDDQLQNSPKPYLVLAERITNAIKTLEAHKASFDVVYIYLPARWQAAFEVEDGFDLHDYLKGATARLGIPCQLLREDKALSRRCRASVMWALSIALYCKAGGVPWKLANVEPDTAFIGLAYALRDADSPRPFVSCCSQVFDSDGAGLEFLAYSTSEYEMDHEGRNPYLSRSDINRIMARSLLLYQQRHAGKKPRKIIVHKSTPFKADEIEGAFDALGSIPEVTLLQIQDSSDWRAIPYERTAGKNRASAYPCQRGTILPVDLRQALLWTSGNAPTAVHNENFYKDGVGIPEPLLVRRFAGHGGWEESCNHILGLTKMNWNNDALYDRLPVTLSYASRLADIIKRFSNLEESSIPYQFRFFI